MARTWPGQRAAQPSSRAVESAPPLRPTASGRAGVKACRAASTVCVMVGQRSRADGKSAAVGLGVGEAPVALQTGVAALQQVLGLEVGHLAEGVAQSALEQRGHLLGI